MRRNNNKNTGGNSLFGNIRNDFVSAGVEFIGTTFFLIFGLGGIQASTASAARDGDASYGIHQVLYIATCMGLSLIVSAWIFFRATGGLFNPNVSLGLLLVGVIGPLRFVLYCIAQLLGAIAASAIVRSLTASPLTVNNHLAAGISITRGVFIEMFITAALVLAVLMLAAEKHHVTPFAPIGIGLTLFACHLFGVYYTGAAMNTARAFGPAVISGFPFHYHWVYWVGPFLGSLLGAAIYTIMKHSQYWTVNPNQGYGDAYLAGNPLDNARGNLNGGNLNGVNGANGYNGVEKPVVGEVGMTNMQGPGAHGVGHGVGPGGQGVVPGTQGVGPGTHGVGAGTYGAGNRLNDSAV